MRQKGVAAAIIPGTDPHQSEYVCDHWKFRDWVSGFTGSNGTAVVTLDKAGLWTDSRYFLQAGIELEDSGFDLHKEDIPGEATITEWLTQELKEDDVLAVDGHLFSIMAANRLESFCGNNGFMFATDFYPADEIWADRPERPLNPAYVHDEKFAGETVDSKIKRVVEALHAVGAESTFVASLDEIAWLFNIRGTDVAFTPVVIAYAYISEHERIIFIDEAKVTDEVREHLTKYDVKIKPYDEVEHYLERRSQSEAILLDPNRVSDTLGNALPCEKIYSGSPIIDIKSQKNDVQIDGVRHAMERDGAALVRLFMWIEKMAPTDSVNEIDVWEKGKEERAKSDLYRDDSFAMIAGYKEHGAIVHYSATPESASMLHGDGILLVDSGAQYLDGTTDITRTITLGNPTADEIHDFTLVLKGHLAIARAQFPVGTRGVQLDALARMPLWEEGMTYWHGTGHGVGHFLGCHEGPQNIRLELNPAEFKPGMITSDEPGVYKAGKYGIRTECLILCVPGEHSEEFGDFLKFEVLTLFPYDSRLIDLNMLTQQEVDQINAYHKTVRERLDSYLNDDEKAWLAEKTKELKK
jgi:Xaa-Pro aminopeptidase